MIEPFVALVVEPGAELAPDELGEPADDAQWLGQVVGGDGRELGELLVRALEVREGECELLPGRRAVR